MDVKIVSRQLLKPYAPTPSHLRNFNLSALDQIASSSYIPLLLFYPHNYGTPGRKLEHLKTSLSRILTTFYPIAGKVKENVLVECNDDGVNFVEAQTSSKISDILEKPDIKMLAKLLPPDIDLSTQDPPSHLLTVQITSFSCGGIVIGLLFSHKIFDACTMSFFVNSWAAASRLDEDGSGQDIPIPDFVTPSRLFPPGDVPPSPFMSQTPPRNRVTKRFVFNGEKISMLKAKGSSTRVPRPSRVTSICALIWKTAMTTSTFFRTNCSYQPSLFIQMVNLRNKTRTPLPTNAFGNLLTDSNAQFDGEEGLDLKNLVWLQKMGLEEVIHPEMEKKVMMFDERIELLKSVFERLDNLQMYGCSSWCAYPFYEADFGWGKPDWVSIVEHSNPIPHVNLIILLDTKDGDGVEAWVALEKQHMDFFECDQELLEFASLNPSVNFA